MAGKLLTADPAIVPGKHEYLVLVTSTTALVFNDYRMFGKVTCESLPEKGRPGSIRLPAWWRTLPPQPHEEASNRTRFRELLHRGPRRPLKALILDQDKFPGIGNWMAEEIL
jgi:formamidopyrimidine-DNA glycosylase